MTDLSVGEVAKRFRVTPKTIARWADAGKLRHSVTAGGHRRFDEVELEEDIKALERERNNRKASSS